MSRHSMPAKLAAAAKAYQQATTDNEREKHAQQLIKLMNEANATAGDRRENNLRKLVRKKKPSKAEVKAGTLMQLQNLLNDTFETQQRNEPKIRRLFAKAGNVIDDSNIRLHMQVRKLQQEGNVHIHLRKRRMIYSRRVRPAAAKNRTLGDLSRDRIQRALSSKTQQTSTRALGEEIGPQVYKSPERVRKLVSELRRRKK